MDLWGHGDLDQRTYQLPNGDHAYLIGSPSGDCGKSSVIEYIEGQTEPTWNGRYVLLIVSSDGESFTMFNDWVGSVPVYCAAVGAGYIASSLEPVVVDGAGFTVDDFYMPGVLSLLINGHFIGDRTLFDGMRIVRGDTKARWDGERFVTRQLDSVVPGEDLWTTGSDELVDQMAVLSRNAIEGCLSESSSWVLPLSGGLDSRMIAAVGAEMGVTMRAYTYGASRWNEVVYAKAVAKRLGLSWKRIDLGTDYLAGASRMWADWFGSSLHFHGMYQVPFLDALADEPGGRIVHGFMGDPLAGNHVTDMVASHAGRIGPRAIKLNSEHWGVEQARLFFRESIDDALDELDRAQQAEIDAVDGSDFQKYMFLDFWNRQRLFIFYHPMMYDYYRGVSTPFVDREYARFCMRLPRLALEGRDLQVKMIQRYYPRMAEIPCTIDNRPLTYSTGYQLARSVMWRLPRMLHIGPLRQFHTCENRLAAESIAARGCETLWPIDIVGDELGDWFDMSVMDQVMGDMLAGEPNAHKKIMALQTIAYRMLTLAGSAKSLVREAA